MTEQQIRARMREDTAQGQRVLFDTYYNYVYAIVFRQIQGFGTHEDAEDCVIEVFSEIIRHYADIQDGSLKAYIAKAAKNKALNVCRSLGNRSGQSVSLDSEELVTLPSAENIAADTEQKELTHRLLDAIEALGEPDSAIIIQKYYLGHNAAEIGRTLHMNPITVRSRLHRAIKRLRTELADLDITL